MDTSMTHICVTVGKGLIVSLECSRHVSSSRAHAEIQKCVTSRTQLDAQLTENHSVKEVSCSVLLCSG